MTNITTVIKMYELAREHFAQLGVNTDEAIKCLNSTSISIPCWQGDDVHGFENISGKSTDIIASGNYPGRARTADELRADIIKALLLVPGKHRVNLHSIYGNFEGKVVERNQFKISHYLEWIDWAIEKDLKIDFNATCFNHPISVSGFTLSHKNRDIRKYWIDHVNKCREISAYIGRELKSPCIHNLWIPDGSKDITTEAMWHRWLLKESLDEIYSHEYDLVYLRDSLEPKLFGMGTESYVVGSLEFYYGYALRKNKMLCLDTGHFHPTESVGDKVSSMILYFDELLLHISRGVRWDSDHVPVLNDELLTIAQEIVRSNALNKVRLALDFFDPSINRVGAWVIGTRAMQKALLLALLEPANKLKQYQDEENNFGRLALLEEMKNLPWGIVWDYYCFKNDVPVGEAWIKEVMDYEHNVLSKR
jgi:L-rhamnose isomerase